MKKVFITVTGTKFYFGQEFLEKGMSITLKKDPDNEYDKEAIKAEMDGLGQIGHVANSVSTGNGAAISGDPGASQEFPFSIQFANVGANPDITAKSVQLIVTDDAGNTATCTITQAAGDATLSVSPASVQLDWNAATAETSASFTVTSNTNWTIE